MKKLILFIISLYALPLCSYADAKSVLYDTVRIGHIPSRGEIFKGAPYIALEANVLSQHKNADIHHFFTALKNIADEGVTDNATQFHQPVVFLEVVYQGERVRLSYSGASTLAKFKVYEDVWKLLHSEMYHYLTKDIKPTAPMGQFRRAN